MQSWIPLLSGGWRMGQNGSGESWVGFAWDTIVVAGIDETFVNRPVFFA